MKRAKGTFWMRCSILMLAVAFGVLVYWSAGFLLDDIRVIRMPDRSAYFKEHEDRSLQLQLEQLQERLEELGHKHDLIGQQRGFIKDSSESLKTLVDNLFTLKNRDQQLISEDQFAQVLSMLDKVISIQDEFKDTATRYLETTNERFEVQKQIKVLQKQIETQRAEIGRAFAKEMHRHRMLTSVIQLLFLLPGVVVCTFLIVKKHKSIYRLIYFSAAIAVYVKTASVIHAYFPSRYFKYVVTIALLLLVAWGFGWLMRRLVKPRIDILLQQYRQAYERFLCPVCEYPIRTGPRKYLYWTRRTVHKTALASNPGIEDKEEPYSCPACGTDLFETCDGCGKICHSLLPGCQHCGRKKTISGDAY